MNDDILVMARRRSESQFKVPISVTALSDQSLVKQGIQTEQDLQGAVPGFLARQLGSANVLAFSLRGQSIDGYSTSPPAVLPYINEFQVAAPGASTFFDLQSVEVLKGPQGTLFGRNTTGGAVLYRTKAPGDKIEGYVAGRYGSFETLRIEGAVTLPIVQEKVSLRVAGTYGSGGGFVKNLGYYANSAYSGGAPSAVTFIPRDQTLGDIEDFAVRATLLVKPFDGFQTTTMAQYGKATGTQTPGLIHSQIGTIGAQSAFEFINVGDGPFRGFGALSQNIAWQRGTNRSIYTSSSNDYRAKTLLVTNSSELELSDAATLKNIIGWYKTDRNMINDFDGSAFTLYTNSEFFQDTPPGRNGFHNTDWTFSEELQLRGKLLAKKLDYVLGVYYSSSRHLDDDHLKFFDFQLLPYRQMTRDRSTAAFAQATYNATDRFHVTGGFRYSEDKVDAAQLPGGFFSPPIFGGFPPAVASTFEQTQKTSFRNSSWTISLDYQVTPSLLAYVTQRGSWRAGGFNFSALPRTYDSTGAVTASNPLGLTGNLFRPERARDVEGGLKFSGVVGDVPVNFTFAIYNQWVSNVQRSAFVTVLNAPGLVTVNVAKSEVTGQEASLSIKPAPWLSLGGQLSHTLARYTDPLSSAAGVTRTYGPYGDVPEWSGAAFVEVRKELADGGALALRGDVFSQSSYEFKNYTPAGSGDTKIPGYSLVNGRLSWENIAGSGFGVAVYGKNLFDTKWYAGGIPTETAFGVNVAAPGRPREIGGELRFTF